MNRRRRFVFIIVLLSVTITTIYNSYQGVFNLVRLFLPHAGYPLNQDQVLARFRVQRHQTKHVPRIIHQVFHNWQRYGNGTAMLPEWESQRQSCIQQNPDWEYMLWTGETSREFLQTEFPWFLDTYDHFKYPIQKEHTVRYFLLRHYGGIYIDLDYGCVKPLESLRAYPAFVTDRRRGTLSDTVLGGAPNHAFWVQITESIPKYSHFYILPFLTILYGTGSWFITDAWDRYHPGLFERYNGTHVPLTRLSMPQWRGAPEWSIFSSYRGGTAKTWRTDIFVFAGEHWIIAIISGVFGCIVGIYLGWKMWKKRCSRRRRGGYRPIPESRV